MLKIYNAVNILEAELVAAEFATLLSQLCHDYRLMAEERECNPLSTKWPSQNGVYEYHSHLDVIILNLLRNKLITVPESDTVSSLLPTDMTSLLSASESYLRQSLESSSTDDHDEDSN